MITQSYLLEKNNSKINTSLINNTISCYKRPHLNYQKKSDIKIKKLQNPMKIIIITIKI